MNDSILNATSSDVYISELIQTAYINYIVMLIQCGMLSLLIYTTTLAIPLEMIYMWLSPKPFSIPNLLYAITRYTSVLSQTFNFWIFFLLPGSICNNVAYTALTGELLSYVGVQGLVVTRTYALCRGNKIVTAALALSFGAGLTAIIYEVIITGGCRDSVSPVADLIGNICTALTDLIAITICLWEVWGTWRLKRDTGIQSRNDLVSVILRQTISRFCFVISFSTALTIIDQVDNGYAVEIVGGIQQSLSAILLADFMLDLRQQNSTAIQAADITLPTIQIRSIANYIHQSILVEMGDHETSVHTRAEDNDDDLSTGSPDVGIGSSGEASALDT